MSIQHGVKVTNFRDKLKEYQQWVEEGKKKPEPPSNPNNLNSWIGTFIGLSILLFVPSCTATAVMSEGNLDSKAFWGMVL